PYLNDENSVAVMLKHVNAPLPRISEFLPAENPYLDAVMYRVLAKSPDERHPSTQAFFADLMNALAGDMQTTPPFLETQTTKVLAPTQIMAEPALPRKLAHPSVGLLAVGVTVIVFIGAIILMERSSSLNVAQSAASSVEDMTGMIAFYFNSTFEAGADTNDEWPQGSGDLNPEITTDGFYHLRNESPGTAGTSIFNPEYRYEDVAIDLEGTLTEDSQRASAYGIVFNYHDQDNYSVFAVDGVGRYSIWTRTEGVWRELRGEAEAWTPHEAVLGVGENNHLRIEIHGSHYLGYVNDTLVADVIDNTAPSGSIGIYLATPDSGTAGALIDRYSVAPSSGSTPSMTGSDS
ncbi:MAG: hypothetical protein K8I30_00260, partial [Anaerolineae bacterium]|nr:hypothetical protein [Anaerolineae bacterium]